MSKSDGTVLWLNQVMSVASWLLAVAQIPFIINFFWSFFYGKKVQADNPWQGTTLEWAAPAPPGHGNFLSALTVYRDPYEYSVPGADKIILLNGSPMQSQKFPKLK